MARESLKIVGVRSALTAMKMIADLSIDVSMSRCPCDGFLRLVQCTPIVVKIYPHIYPLWDIAFALVFIYTDSVEVLLVSAPQTSVATSSGHV